ncbi:MAG: hypothetical protein JNK04_10670, partial [Myxococcales bacterium]|nr:hypothetical protein [Myxococcales bacterium]
GLATIIVSLAAASCGGELFVGGGGGAGLEGGAGGGGGGGSPPVDGLPLLGSDCDPMVPSHCGLPFPSNVYLLDDPSGRNPSGKSVRFGATTLPKNQSGVHIVPDDWFDLDGFSPVASPMTHLPGATSTGLATPYTIASSLEAGSPTVLLDVETGERVPHWVDIDMSTDQDENRLLMIRPAARLRDGARYLVAIRDVVDANGVALPPSPVFSALRSGEALTDGSDTDAYSVEARRDLYEDIFGALEAAGVARDDLQIAWDFSTASRESCTSRMLELRDKALAVVGEEGPTFEVLSVEEFPTPADHPYLLRRIEVAMTVPLFLTSGAETIDLDDEPPVLNVDEAGALIQNGTMTLPVLIHVPRSVETAEPHGLLQNGHGLFGDRHEGQNSFLAWMANDDHYIPFAMNLFGFDENTEDYAGQILAGRFDAFKSFTERQIQGMVNQLLAMRMMKGRVASDGIVDDDGNVLFDPAWVDDSVLGYRGDSQGGIMGATYMAVSTDVTRGLLGEPGMAYSLLLNRSVDWTQYETILKAGYGDNAIDVQLILSVLQMLWDRSEPSGFAPYLENDPLPNTPSHRVVLHLGRGDHQVSTFAAHLLARSIGASQLASDDPAEPVFEDLFGIPQVAAPTTTGSVLVEHDFALPANPAVNLPQAEGCDPHDRVRMLTPSFVQQNIFLRTGEVIWACNGACNCDDTGVDLTAEAGCVESFADQCQD